MMDNMITIKKSGSAIQSDGKYEKDVKNDAALIRTEVFIEEQGFRDEFDELDSTAQHIVAYVQEIPVACGRVYPTGESSHRICTIGRIAVRKTHRGQHLGKLIVSALEQAAQETGAEHAVLSAQVQAQGFYESLGYTADGDVYMDEHCPHIHMEKMLK